MMFSARLLPVVAAGRQYGDSRREKGGTGTRSPDRGGGGNESDWMQKARKLANKRASQFRRERGAQPVAPAQWRRKRKGEKGDEYGYVEAARGYDDIRKVADDKDELTATAGDGLWRVDFGDLAEEDWGSQLSLIHI